MNLISLLTIALLLISNIGHSKSTIQNIDPSKNDVINSILDTIPNPIYTAVDKMPLFPGCNDHPSYQLALHCNKRMFTNYYLDSVRYPDKAIENEAEGLAIIKCTVDKMGFIQDAKIYRDPGYDLGEEALRLVKAMNQLPNRWTPGVLNGANVAVNVKLEIPFEIKFKKNIQSDEYLKNPIEVLTTYYGKGNKVFKVVERMPRFPGCEDIIGNSIDKKKCAEDKMVDYIYRNLRYPEDSRKKGIEGTVVTQFNVDVDGYLKNITVQKPIADDLDQEAIRIIKSMNHMDERWTPGKQRDREVIVMYTMPIRFKLQ